MNKRSKALLTLFLLLGTNAYSKNVLIRRENLDSKHLDPVVLKQLIDEKILLPSKMPLFFELNEKKVEQILSTSNDPELSEFLTWLRSLVGDGTEVNQKNPGDMTPASQDIKGTI